MAAYTNTHRAFLQGLMVRPYIDMTDAKEMLARIKSAEEETEIDPGAIPVKEVNDLITGIISAISPFDLEIREMPDQSDGSRQWSLVNVADDEIIRMATTHSADEIAYFKRLLDEMFETSNTPKSEIMAVKGMRALTLNKNAPSEREVRVVATQDVNGEETTQRVVGAGFGLTKQEAEEALAKFIDEGWLERDNSGFHYLSTRALLELEMYLIDTYNISEDEEDEEGNVTRGAKKLRIKHCNVCKYIHTMGQRCSKRDCPIRMHNRCADTFFNKSADSKCPGCASEWKGDPVGPKAAGVSAGDTSGLRRARGRESDGIQPQRMSKSQLKAIEKSKGRKSAMFANNSIDEMDEDEGEGDVTIAGSSGSRQSLGRRNRASLDDEDGHDEAPPRKLSRIMNGSSRRSSGVQRSQYEDEEDDEEEDERRISRRHARSSSPGSAAIQIKRESQAGGQTRHEYDDDDEDEEEELPRRMSNTTLKSRRR